MTTPDPYQRRILSALNVLNKHVFAGIESPKDRADRRARARRQTADALPDTRRGRRARALAFRSEIRNARREVARATA